ncbi:MAG: hypothetical protein AAGJ95_13985 [Cyanobacteria bacterium J06554_11]
MNDDLQDFLDCTADTHANIAKEMADITRKQQLRQLAAQLTPREAIYMLKQVTDRTARQQLGVTPVLDEPTVRFCPVPPQPRFCEVNR